MVPIKQNLVPKEKYSIKCPYEMIPEALCIHNTANDAPAENEVAYMIRNNNKTSFHWAVDDVCVVQGIPENRNAYHAGDGGGRGNRKTLSIEICYSKSGGPKFDKAERNAAEFAASILKKYGWGIDKLTKHQDYSGKYCPHRTLDMGWDRFVKMVESYLDKSIFSDMKSTHWGYPFAVDLFERGIVNGVGKNKINPDKYITRAEVAVMLYRTVVSISGIIHPMDGVVYTDVSPDHWAYNAIKFITDIGIVEGYGQNIFKPDSNVTRAELAVMVRNTLNFFGSSCSVGYTNVTFSDVDETHWAYTHIKDLYNMGIVSGYLDNTYKPSYHITRIETITIISRMIKCLGK